MEHRDMARLKGDNRGTTDQKCEEGVNARQKSNGRKNGQPPGVENDC